MVFYHKRTPIKDRLVLVWLQALYVNPADSYDLHWPMKHGRLNTHDGPGGTVTAVLADLETIWATAIQKHLDIPLKDLKVKTI